MLSKKIARAVVRFSYFSGVAISFIPVACNNYTGSYKGGISTPKVDTKTTHMPPKATSPTPNSEDSIATYDEESKNSSQHPYTRIESTPTLEPGLTQDPDWTLKNQPPAPIRSPTATATPKPAPSPYIEIIPPVVIERPVPLPIATTKPTPAPVPPSSPINLKIRFKQERGSADFRNCLAIQVNEGQRFDLGCNHDGDLTKESTVTALSKPSTNQVRLIFSSRGSERGTTANGSANALMRVSKVDSKTFQIGYEDSTDNDFNDYVFSISTDADVKLAIENCTGSQCVIN